MAKERLTRTVGGKYKHPLFYPNFLGDKYPTADLIVNLLDNNSKTIGFFFAQVKGTATSKAKAKRLGVTVDLDKYKQLVSIPLPTYVIGVDTEANEVYLIGAMKATSKALSSMTKRHDLSDEAVRIKLYNEVLANYKKLKATAKTLSTQFGNGN